MSHTYKFPRPSLTVDLVVFGSSNGGDPDHALLIRRGKDPFKNHWAIPGGYFDMADESVEAAAARELREETGLDVPIERVKQVGVFSRPDRDPRGCVVSTAHYTVVSDMPSVKGQDDAKEARWFPISQLKSLPLAFDHKEILAESVLALLSRITRSVP